MADKIELEDGAWYDVKEFAWSRYYIGYLESRLHAAPNGPPIDSEEYKSIRDQFDSEWLQKIKKNS